MKQIRSILLTSLLAFFSVSSYAVETVVVVTDEWSSYTNKDGTGYYFDVLRAVFPAPDYKIDYKIVPYARSLKLLEGKEAHIVLGIYEGEIPDKQISKWVVERDLVDALVSPALGKSWSGVESLAGKNVVAKIGYGFDGITDVKMSYSEKSSLESMVKMLKAGRADAVLDYEEDLQPIISKVKLGSEYVLKKSVMGSDIFFGFSNDASGKKYLDRFNVEFKKLWDAKKIHEIMAKNVGETGSLPETQ